MKSIDQLIADYARLVIESGVRLYRGQSLMIKTGYDTYYFARALAQCAYDHGAILVQIEIDDPFLTRKRTDVQSVEELSNVPDFFRQMDYEMMVKDWAYIRIDNTEDRHWLAEAKAEGLSALRSALSKSGTLYRNSRMRHEHPWCVICAPGPIWAKRILGEQATVEDLWNLLEPILKLNTPDPALAWQQHSDTLVKRGEWLNSLRIENLRFQSAKTDLTIGFRPEHLWLGGGDPLPNGTWFLPNIPTEEVFTTPDFATASGHVATTRPVSVMDSLVEDAVLRFEQGKVVSCTARVGQQIMDRFLQMDAGASLLGEVALVDEDSPIALSGKVFGSILFDENASCHLALGAGYPSCLSNSARLNGERQLREAGCNTSLVHTDFMVGSADMRITAKTRDGRSVQIMENGRFVGN
jgi:aminopeptidase